MVVSLLINVFVNAGNSMLTCTNRVAELKRIHNDKVQQLTDLNVKKLVVFKKLHKPNRPISRDYSFPFYKQMCKKETDVDVILERPNLRIGRELTTILDYTDFNHNTYNNFRLPPLSQTPRKLSRSDNTFLTTNVIPHSNKTWPFVYSPNTTANDIPVGIFDTSFAPPQLCKVKNIKLQLKADKAVIHKSAKQRDKDFSKPQWTAILDVPHPTPDLFGSSMDIPDVKHPSQSGTSCPAPHNKGYKVQFARGGGFISRIPLSDKTETNEEESDSKQ